MSKFIYVSKKGSIYSLAFMKTPFGRGIIPMADSLWRLTSEYPLDLMPVEISEEAAQLIKFIVLSEDKYPNIEFKVNPDNTGLVVANFDQLLNEMTLGMRERNKPRGFCFYGKMREEEKEKNADKTTAPTDAEEKANPSQDTGSEESKGQTLEEAMAEIANTIAGEINNPEGRAINILDLLGEASDIIIAKVDKGPGGDIEVQLKQVIDDILEDKKRKHGANADKESKDTKVDKQTKETKAETKVDEKSKTNEQDANIDEESKVSAEKVEEATNAVAGEINEPESTEDDIITYLGDRIPAGY